jgi:hypothetical protein
VLWTQASFSEVVNEPLELASVRGPVWKQQVAEAIDQLSLLHDLDLVAMRVLENFVRQVSFADADGLTKQTPSFAHCNQVLFEGLCLASLEFTLDPIQQA